MGTFDEVHSGVRCGQTKALGRKLGRLVAGDAAQIYPAPMNDEEHQAWLRGESWAVAQSGQVLMPEGGYLTLADGIFIDWVDGRDPVLPLFSELGHPLEEPVDLAEYPYLDADLGFALEAAADGDFSRWPDPADAAREWELAVEVGLVDVALADPEWAVELRAAAREQLRWRRGEPADCPVCAAVRGGTATRSGRAGANE